jgi:hypothetical protein
MQTEMRETSHASAIEKTMEWDADDNYKFRYLMVAQGRDDASGGNSIDGFTRNLDIQEAVAVSPTGALYGPLVGPLGGPI